MNKRTSIYGAVALVVVVLIGGVVSRADSNSPTGTNQQGKTSTPSSSRIGGAATKNAASATTPHIAAGTANAPPIENANAKTFLQGLLAQIGTKGKPPVAQYLHDEIASGDKARMLRAFNEVVYQHFWDKSDVVAALKPFLNDSTPYVRYLSGRDFLIMGENEGYAALLGLVQSHTSLDGLNQDVRVEAAEILAQFRQKDATQAIYNLYQQTHNGALISPLEKLGAPQAATIVESRGFYAEVPPIIHYGLSGATQFIPQITSTFHHTQNPELKAASAWALATMTNDQNAIDYLVRAAQAAIDSNGQTAYGNSWQVIEYLGSIQNPQVKPLLETALGSSSSGVVQAAAVNLVFNQGGSSKVNQMVAALLSGPPNLLGADLVLDLAPQLLSDPQVQAAGEIFSHHDGSGAWQRATVERGSWPVYNWIDSYVVKLNK